VPLSEHEQRLLEQIEQSLYAEDPKFARSWRSTSVRGVHRARLVRAVVGFVIGLGLLLGGVITLNGSTVVGVVLGVVGFLIMLASAWFAASARAGVRATARGRARGERRPRRSLVSRLEERWHHRRDGT
jgi:Protein of unknown function (DUF3040)